MPVLRQEIAVAASPELGDSDAFLAVEIRLFGEVRGDSVLVDMT